MARVSEAAEGPLRTPPPDGALDKGRSQKLCHVLSCARLHAIILCIACKSDSKTLVLSLTPPCPAAAGPARTSFHGVPRVLLSRPAEGLRTGDSTSADSKRSAAAEDAPPLDAAMAEYMSRARINVSVRQVAGCRSTHQDA